MTFNRWVLDTFTTWELGLVLVGACGVVAFGGHLFARRFVERVENRVVSTAFGIVTGLFSFVLAFTIGQLYVNFTSAATNVDNEATALSQLVRSADYLGGPEGKATSRFALAYAKTVETQEWNLMRKGEASPEAWRLVDEMYGELSRYTPKTPAESAFYGQAISQLQTLVDARRTRLDEANETVPGAFEVMLAIGAVLALLTTLNFKPADDRLQLLMIGAASILVGTALLVALSLDAPFSGEIAVSKAPFTQITLAQLDR